MEGGRQLALFREAPRTTRKRAPEAFTTVSAMSTPAHASCATEIVPLVSATATSETSGVAFLATCAMAPAASARSSDKVTAAPSLRDSDGASQAGASAAMASSTAH